MVISPDALLIRLMDMDQWSVVSGRGLFAFLGLTTVAANISRRSGRTLASTFASVGAGGIFIAISGALANVLFVVSITHTYVANTLVMFAATPLLAAMLSRAALRERVRLGTWLASGGVLVAIAIILSRSLLGSGLGGDLAALGATALLAANLVVVRARRAVNVIPALAMSGGLSALSVIGLADLSSIDLQGAALLFLNGYVVVPLALSLMMLAPTFIPAPDVALINLLEIVLGPLWVLLAVGEAPPATTLLAGGLIAVMVAAHAVAQLTRTPLRHGRQRRSSMVSNIPERRTLQKDFADGYEVRAADATLFAVTKGQGHPLLVLHGGLGPDHTYLRPWLDPLTSSGIEVTYLDQRGGGRSSRGDLDHVTHGTLVEDADTIRGVLNHDRIVLMGHSYGGMVALEYALRHPERLQGLILCCTAPSWDYDDEIHRNAERRGGPAELDALHRLHSGASDDAEFGQLWQAIQPLYFVRPNSAMIQAIHRQTRYSVAAYNLSERLLANFDLSDRLQEISVPTLVIAGADDWVTPLAQAERLVAGIPSAELAVFEDSGHYPFIEEPDRFLTKVGGWIADIGASTGPGDPGHQPGAEGP